MATGIPIITSEAESLISSNNNLITSEITRATETENGLQTAVDTINNTTIPDNLQSAKDYSDSTKLSKAGNLIEIVSPSTARANLNTMSVEEVQTLVSTTLSGAGTFLGTYADNTAVENVFNSSVGNGDSFVVSNDGDGKSALYYVLAKDTDWATTRTGSGIFKIDNDSLLNSLTGSSIKTAYESNSDTNAFTDSEKSKIANISVSENIDLDKVIQSDELETDLSQVMTHSKIASAQAIKEHINQENFAFVLNEISAGFISDTGAFNLSGTPTKGTQNNMMIRLSNNSGLGISFIPVTHNGGTEMQINSDIFTPAMGDGTNKAFISMFAKSVAI